jgi:hypothetical protein
VVALAGVAQATAGTATSSSQAASLLISNPCDAGAGRITLTGSRVTLEFVAPGETTVEEYVVLHGTAESGATWTYRSSASTRSVTGGTYQYAATSVLTVDGAVAWSEVVSVSAPERGGSIHSSCAMAN